MQSDDFQHHNFRFEYTVGRKAFVRDRLASFRFRFADRAEFANRLPADRVGLYVLQFASDESVFVQGEQSDRPLPVSRKSLEQNEDQEGCNHAASDRKHATGQPDHWLPLRQK